MSISSTVVLHVKLQYWPIGNHLHRLVVNVLDSWRLRPSAILWNINVPRPIKVWCTLSLSSHSRSTLLMWRLRRLFDLNLWLSLSWRMQQHSTYIHVMSSRTYRKTWGTQGEDGTLRISIRHLKFFTKGCRGPWLSDWSTQRIEDLGPEFGTDWQENLTIPDEYSIYFNRPIPMLRPFKSIWHVYLASIRAFEHLTDLLKTDSPPVYAASYWAQPERGEFEQLGNSLVLIMGII